jgi:hypothetical protein
MTAFIKLQRYLAKRRKYLLYLKRTDFNSYSYIIKYYGLKDFDSAQHKIFKRYTYTESFPLKKQTKKKRIHWEPQIKMNKNLAP